MITRPPSSTITFTLPRWEANACVACNTNLSKSPGREQAAGPSRVLTGRHVLHFAGQRNSWLSGRRVRTKPVGVGRLLSRSHSPPTTISVVLRRNTLQCKGALLSTGVDMVSFMLLGAGLNLVAYKGVHRTQHMQQHWAARSGGGAPVHGDVKVPEGNYPRHNVEPPEEREWENLPSLRPRVKFQVRQAHILLLGGSETGSTAQNWQTRSLFLSRTPSPSRCSQARG